MGRHKPAGNGKTTPGVTAATGARLMPSPSVFAASLFCLLCVCGCGGGNDEGNAPPPPFARVIDELKAGRREATALTAEGIAVEIRSLRVMAKRLVREGDLKGARKVMLQIQRLERQLEQPPFSAPKDNVDKK